MNNKVMHASVPPIITHNFICNLQTFCSWGFCMPDCLQTILNALQPSLNILDLIFSWWWPWRLLSSGMCCAVWHMISNNQSYPNDAANKFLWNVGNKLPGYTVSYPRKWQSSRLNIITYCYLNQQIPIMIVCGNEYKFWYLKACTTQS